MGFLYWLNPINWFRRRPATTTTTASTKAETATPAASTSTATRAPATTASTTTKTSTTTKKSTTKSTNAKCAAITASGDQCSRASRDASKYCGLHKNYRAGAPKATPKKVTSKKTTTKATKAVPAPRAGNAQCAAVTAAGAQCSRASRDTSKYCGLHKSYRPTADGAKAKDTKPTRKDVKDTLPAARKTAAKKTPAKKAAKKAATKKAPAKKAAAKKAPAKKAAAKKTASTSSQVSHGAYKLYQSGNRYYFSKKSQAEAKKTGATPVTAMPSGRIVVETPNGMPVLKKA